LAAPALAADLQPKLVKAPAPIPVSTWDGFYFGASVGWEQTSSKWNTTCFTAIGQCPDNNFPVDASSPHTFNNSGARVGAYFGVNWQVAPAWLVGVEADVGFNDKTSKVTGIVGCTINCGAFAGTGITPAFDSTSIRTSWDGSLRVRAGYLLTPAFLVYGTGGLAERMIDANVTCNGATSPWCTFNDNQTFSNHLQTGWTIGGGLEWKALNNVVLRGEYRYSDYGTWSPTFFQGSADELHAKIDSHTHMALFGVSYLFGGTPVK
jgi:outer membrane immunogenic protein